MKLRVENLRDGQWWRFALQKSARQLHDPAWWQQVLQTERRANKLFRLSTKFQGLLFDLLWVRYAGWPYRLVDLLSEDPAVQEEGQACLLSARPCMLDEYSLNFRDAYPTKQDMSSAAAKAELFTVLATLVGTTFDTERLHSTNLRRLKARKQTHRMALHDIALCHMGVAATKVTAAVYKDESLPHMQHVPETSNTAKGKKPGRGGGGAWRAFVHIEGQTKLGSGKPDFRELARRYSYLTPDQKRFYQDVGYRGSMVHRHGLPSFPTTVLAAQKQVCKTTPIKSPYLTHAEMRPQSLDALGPRATGGPFFVWVFFELADFVEV